MARAERISGFAGARDGKIRMLRRVERRVDDRNGVVRTSLLRFRPKRDVS
jgi:hypothetical protein